jgi:broad specificity phosphatase PhoE
VPFPGGGQSYRDVVDATAGFLDDVRRDHDGERVLVIAHSANRWALQHLLDGRPLEQLVSEPFGWQPGWEWTLT